ncbi:hypothetical protein [Curtobacterium sp. MCBD17_003]|uniref:hypothetical protein n=1 Tax=Curtobacterium sp. MCBD17_003 TaxID=2175667 RepID=UPI0015E89284|nr:hypothetical protein [Curtobacterium sp. MCBD17_003]WIE56072.1 hypothetical protein DEI88_007745 [Curtobacterium sp. MCBD17_003]
MTTPDIPSSAVFVAFGAGSGPSHRLSGGRGATWRAGDVVVRPAGDPDEANWRSAVLESLPPTAGFRTARPIRAADGGWLSDGWEAWQWLPGHADETRVVDVIRAGAAFHRALATLPRPDFLDHTDDPWSRADRMAWGEDTLPPGALLDRLAAAFVPVRSPSQAIHGDLLGNVLFEPGAAPAIIDWAPYWRPAGLGAAIAAVDATCWHRSPVERLDDLGRGVAEWRQLLVRALVFRIATLHLLGWWSAAMDDRHRPVVDVVAAR